MKLRTLLREGFSCLVLYSGVAALIRRTLWRDRAAILLYHDPRPATLDAHLNYLKTLCDIVPLARLHDRVPGRPRAVVTLDDGHAGNAALLPVFIKHGIRPTIFICTGIVAHPRSHWWLHPGAALGGLEPLKRLSNRARLEALAAHGYRQDASDAGQPPTGLSVGQIEAMRPYVDFQSHTRFHPILTRCEEGECRDEIAISRHEVEQLSGARCTHLAYPNGNYTGREMALLRRAGYETGRTCDVGWNDASTDRFRLKAIDIQDDSSVRWFAAQLTGVPLFLRYLRQGGGWAGRKPQF